ncbi:MAG: mechanosensitive ion channel [Proteobacteria bacterium]|nr:mechanosensitive ion channel [Pseudomonadota bacterium]MBU1687103.1 mechanosensitive ion channel [Pseudomonadota bacterium]
MINQKNPAGSFLIFLLFFFMVVQPVLAAFPGLAPETKPQAAAPVTVETLALRTTAIQQKIKVIGDRIGAAKNMENEATANRFAMSLEDLTLRTTVLRETEIIYQRQLAALTKQESLQNELIILDENGAQGTDKTISQRPPYSLNVYDYYFEQLANSTRQIEVAAQALTVGKKLLLEANETLLGAEKKLRALAETTQKDTAAGEWQKLLADDGKELAQARIDLLLLNADNYGLELKRAELKRNIDQQNISWLKENLTFSEEELAGHLESIDARRDELEQRIDKLLFEQNIAENKWLAAQRQVDPTQPPDERKSAIDTAYLQAREAWRETYLQVISHNSSMLQLLNREAQLWQRRYAYLKKETPAGELKNWRNEARVEIEALGRTMALQQSLQNNVQAKIAATKLQLSKENIDPEVNSHIESTIQALSKLGERNFEYLSVLQGASELNQRLLLAIDEHLQEFNLGEQVDVVMATIKGVWTYELFVVDTQGVTIGKTCIALIILIVGIMFAGFFTRWLHRRMLLRLKMGVHATAITEKLTYYITLLMVIFIAMRSVNIPMTAFAFLGGAVAIGAGFGAQKLINNFISGFILMVEQPIRVGDLVQMDTYLGRIEDIGVRSTKVLTFDNVQLLVPNSYFLENNIINWTHNDNMVRARVTVGVVYGSATKLVKKQLLEAAAEHGEILKDPEPFVLFEDFGDNSLVFTLYFWILVARVMDKKRIESDIRFIVEKLFQDENLVIAFPQRDVHLDSSRPLEIKIIKEEGGESGSDQQPCESA